MADFTGMSLEPSFDFNLIANDGKHDPDNEQGKSGLPSRTFVGPLTFVLNTNGSALRPTDTLGEKHCGSAFCEMPEVAEGYENSPVSYNYETPLKRDGDKEGESVSESITSELQQDLLGPVYRSGLNINKTYEENRYYGYLGDYQDYSVDGDDPLRSLLNDKLELTKRKKWEMETGSEISHFVKRMRLKYTVLEEDTPDEFPHDRSELYDVSVTGECAFNKNRSMDYYYENCFTPMSESRYADKYILGLGSFYEQLNDRKYYNEDLILGIYDQRTTPNGVNSETEKNLGLGNPGHEMFGDAEDYFWISDKEFDKTDLLNIIRYTDDLNSHRYDHHLVRMFKHRMCFVLAQNLFAQEYFQRKARGEKISKYKNLQRDQKLLDSVEMECQELLGRYYGYPERNRIYGGKQVVQEDLADSKYDRPVSEKLISSPIVIERMLRVSDTTGKYIYRGGKSLNINVQTSFDVKSSESFSTGSSGYFKPYSWFQDVLGELPLVGGLLKTVAGGFNISRSNSRDEGTSRGNGTSVSSGTFLVNQQATFDIALGRYERCMVVRFNDHFTNIILRKYNKKKGGLFKPDFDDGPDFESRGVMICSGEKETECMPIKEKYFYFTQHFTEGDMLDTADLHNHPWLLQMRGMRDFQAFAATIGAQEVDYLKDSEWFNQLVGETWDDAKAFKINGSKGDLKLPEMTVVSQGEDINWPLDELSKAYFNVSPTFPGLYTLFKYESEWPYYNTDPGQNSQLCSDDSGEE